jgi:hypothetical protein
MVSDHRGHLIFGWPGACLGTADGARRDHLVKSA